MKIFGIGLSKTGTTSLYRALQILGYKVKDNLGVDDYYAPGDLSSIDIDVLNSNDAFTDTPIPSLYKELDSKFPNSKFILTRRKMDEWLRSCKKQFNEKHAAMQTEAHQRLFMDLYGCTTFNEEKFENGYKIFLSGVFEYFKERPNDLLILDISAGDGWEKLCPFLGKPIPDIPFPKANVTQIRWINIEDIISISLEAGKVVQDINKIMEGNILALIKSGLGPLQILKYVSQKYIPGTSRDRARAIEALTQAAHQTISRRLSRLTPDIPIISPAGKPVPYFKRSKWNHFWLISPLDNTADQINPRSTFAVSIALIEDRKPVLGVIYAPNISTVYFAKTWKRAFKIEGQGEPKPLVPIRIGKAKLLSTSDKTKPSYRQKKKQITETGSKALALCLAAEGVCDINNCIEGTMEWETAAAQAILSTAGFNLIDCNSSNSLLYNKQDLRNGPLNLDQF